MQGANIIIQLIFLLSAMIPALFASEKPYDYVIQNTSIYDGVSSTDFRGDVAIAGDMIVAVGKLNAGDARHVIDAEGLTLAPGFIDAHTHSDFNAFIYPGLPNKIMQGVTTEIAGNCGMSAAPVTGLHSDQIHSVWAREGVDIQDDLPWESFREYGEALALKGMATNLAGLVGHGNLRMAVMGLDSSPATKDQIEEMKKLLVESMEDGAYGISFGLVYLPGLFAREDELTELCRTAARHGGICAFHIRSEGSKLLEAVEEAIRIGEKSKARIQISHLKAAGKANWGKSVQVLKLIEEARGRGLQVQADVYPYTASFAELGVLLPNDYYERKDRIAFFQDESQRQEIDKTLKEYYRAKEMDWNAIVIATTVEENGRSYEGKSIADIAKERGQDPELVLIDLLAANRFEVSAFSFSQSEEVMNEFLQAPYVSVGSDSIADGSRKPHPRAFGTFPKILREYVMEQRKIGWGKAIRKMTSMPAEHFRLEKRGRIEPGYFADLIVFDPRGLAARADYHDSAVVSEGMVWVFVNGEPVLENGEMTHQRSGRFLSLNG